jgi:hypothetical protein
MIKEQPWLIKENNQKPPEKVSAAFDFKKS